MGFRIQNAIEQQKYIVLDGGLATELEERGCDLNSPLWSAKVLTQQPELIYQIHLDYFRAGADVAITASYQGSTKSFLEHGYSESEARELLRDSVSLAARARDQALKELIKHKEPERQLFVAGSIGPYGAYLADGSEYRGDYSLSSEDMKSFHRPRMQALARAGVDIFAIETIPSFAEALVLLELLPDHPALPAWFSFTLKDATHISDGTKLEAVIETLSKSEQVIALGINCISQDLVDEALITLSNSTSKPLIVYPNSGEVYHEDTKTWSGTLAQGQEFSDKAQRWFQKGAKLIGGCCRTNSDTILGIKAALEKYSSL